MLRSLLVFMLLLSAGFSALNVTQQCANSTYLNHSVTDGISTNSTLEFCAYGCENNMCSNNIASVNYLWITVYLFAILLSLSLYAFSRMRKNKEDGRVATAKDERLTQVYKALAFFAILVLLIIFSTIIGVTGISIGEKTGFMIEVVAFILALVFVFFLLIHVVDWIHIYRGGVKYEE